MLYENNEMMFACVLAEGTDSKNKQMLMRGRCSGMRKKVHGSNGEKKEVMMKAKEKKKRVIVSSSQLNTKKLHSTKLLKERLQLYYLILPSLVFSP